MNEPAEIGAKASSLRNAPGRLRNTRIRFGAVLAVAVAVAFVAWLLVGRGGSSFSMAPVTPVAPSALSASGLVTLAEQVGHPVYWAGTKPGYAYEYRRNSTDNIFIRYLPAGTAAGAKGRFLSIGTYRLVDAYGAIQRAAKNKGSVTVKLPNDGLAVYNPARPTAYWFAYPGSHYQVGVFAPTAGEARRLVLEGRVVPVR
jgi:hypothetical protein